MTKGEIVGINKCRNETTFEEYYEITIHTKERPELILGDTEVAFK